MDKTLDKMSNPAEFARLTKLIEVKRRVDIGVSVTRACRDVGYPRSSYYVDVRRLGAVKEESPPSPSTGMTGTTNSEAGLTDDHVDDTTPPRPLQKEAS